MRDSNVFWTEGIIDSIEIDGQGTRLRFKLVPSDSFSIEENSVKLALFKKDKMGAEDNDAKLIACGEKKDCHAGLWFRAESIPVPLLLEARIAQQGVRVGVPKKNFKKRPNEEGFEISQLVI